MPALSCSGVTVRYGPVTAVSDLSIEFAPGLIHAVVGQNGAGKTTFAHVAAGLLKPERGRVFVNGRLLPKGSVPRARAAGVELVHQSFALPPSFTVAEAMEFGSVRKGGIFTGRSLARHWESHLRDLDITVNPNSRIRDLPIEIQQGVEIARALVTESKLLILDEPTAVLSPSGIEILFDRIHRLKSLGVTVVLILHKIREVLAVADTVTVLRGGEHVAGPLPCMEFESASLARMIIGDGATVREGDDIKALTGASAPESFRRSDIAETQAPAAQPLLKLQAVSTAADSEGPPLARVEFALRPGEIVGIAGIEGNGQRTLVRAIAGHADLVAGSILFSGADITRENLTERRHRGLRIIPFERNSEGLSLTSSLWENWSSGALLQGSLLRYVRPARMRDLCDAVLSRWGILYHDCNQPAGSLSGGNAQKLILAREIDEDARLIVAAQPGRGLDIGATAFVWDALRSARDRGCGVLLISSDLDELFDISDRVLVMLSGRSAGEYSPPYDLQAIGAAMTGANQ